MRFLIQRAKNASVSIDGNVVGRIDHGYAVLIGIGGTDTEAIADKMLKKLFGLRIFEDDAGKTNCSLAQVQGSLLLVSQFTLYADCRRGNRPGFTYAAPPAMAENLYEYILAQSRILMKENGIDGTVEHGEFGAEMQVSLTNDGPFTILLDSRELGME